MRASSFICIFTLFAQWSCTEVTTYESENAGRVPTTLTVFDRLENWPRESWLIGCDSEKAVGRYTVQGPELGPERQSLDFCFSDSSHSGYGPDARMIFDGKSLRICLGRDDGYCDERECVTVVLYDECSTFDIASEVE